MQKLSFNDNWIFKKIGEEGGGKMLSVPHDAMLLEKRSADAKSGVNGCYFEGGDYVYEKNFSSTGDLENKTAVLEFEGVYHDAEVFLNGELLARRPYGYTNFYVDITDKLNKNGINTVRVTAKNSDQPNSRWYSGAGIYRPVWLWLGGKKHVELNGVKIKTLSTNPAVVDIQIKTVGSGKVDMTILDDNEVELVKRSCDTDGEVSLSAYIEGARLWSPESPNLYTCRVAFEGDEVTETFGVRTASVSAADGFVLNGERVVLRGACIHSDNGFLGAVSHPFAEERKVRLLKENGYNAIRSAHNPCSKALLSACDRLGMLVMDEYADMWYIHKTKFDYASDIEKWWKRDLADMVDKDFNHPSVVIYSTGNEVSETAQKRGIALCRDMTEFLHERDNRPVSCGVNIFFNYLSSLGFGVYSDKKAEHEATAKKHKAVGSEFFNNLAGLVGSDVMKCGATLHGSDVKTREAFSKLDIAGYNYGILRYKKDVKKYPDRVILGSETFCRDAWYFWRFAREHKAVIGDFVWSGMDYLGECGVGAWEYKDYAPDFEHGVGWLTAGSGRIDLTGKPLGEAAYKRVVYGLDKINMAVVPVGFKKHSPSAWKMTNAMESWSWQGREGKRTSVEVYAYGDSVTLFLNGKQIGKKKCSKTCRTVFKNVKYDNGELTATVTRSGYDDLTCSLKTAEEETRLAVVPENAQIGLDGLCYARLKFCDSQGEVKPLCRGKIKVWLQNGVLLGLGNACPFNADGYFFDTTGTYYGEALAIIKPLETGKLTVFASAGKHSATAEIEVI